MILKNGQRIQNCEFRVRDSKRKFMYLDSPTQSLERRDIIWSVQVPV